MELHIRRDAPVRELVDLHNMVANKLGEAPVSASWKQSKGKLVERLKALKAKMPTTADSKSVRGASGPVIGDTILAMAADPMLSYDEIADSIRTSQGTNTSAKSVASVICIARKNGVKIPKRKKAKRTNKDEK